MSNHQGSRFALGYFASQNGFWNFVRSPKRTILLTSVSRLIVSDLENSREDTTADEILKAIFFCFF